MSTTNRVLLGLIPMVLMTTVISEKLHGFKPLRSDAVPSLLGIGMAKSGTTDLWYSLMEALPEYFNVPARKEMNNLLWGGFEQPASQEAYKKDLHFGGGKPYTVDITPNYFWNQLPTRYAKELLKGTSTVVMLRDPVSMLHSFFNWRKGQLNLNLVEGLSLAATVLTELQLVMQPQRYRKLLDTVYTTDPQEAMRTYEDLARELDIELGVRNINASNNFQGFLMMPLALPPLRLWDEHFQADRTLVIISDAYYSNRTDVFLNAMLPFIFGDDMPKEVTEHKIAERLARLEVHNSQRYTKDLPKALSCMLHTFYEPFNCLLAAWLRDNPKIKVYPPDRVHKGCNLWRNSDMYKACNLDYIIPALSSLQHAPAVAPTLNH